MSESEETPLNGSNAAVARNGSPLEGSLLEGSLLERGVARGIISPEQRAALLAMDADELPMAIEAHRGFNAVTVAYWSGGIAVLAAFAWYLINRWDALGPAGVLGVSLAYALLLVAMARVFWTNGFRHAAAVSTVLAVGMTPIATWSLLAITGWWHQFPELTRGAPSVGEFDWQNVRWLPIDLATILTALIALRQVRFGVLALPIAVALAGVAAHGVSLILDLEIANELGPRLAMAPAVALLSIGYALDRRVSDGEDYAMWFYAAGLVWTAISIVGFLGKSTAIAAHAMLFLSFLFAVAALRLRRKLFLVAATIGFLGYLAYLTFDVFKKTLGYPILLATSGLVIILLAVWFQRRFPDLQERLRAPGPRIIPGAPLALAGAALIALTMILTAMPDAHERIAERYQREAVQRALMRNHRERRPVAKIPVPARNPPHP
ncbi:MAG TPA: hypothetical protein VL524_02940 [Gemmatimonadaceae bacterium]|jgi:hypothetical protein|nr:hypothetical protein [Gemmatimonadaceae bacterium]